MQKSPCFAGLAWFTGGFGGFLELNCFSELCLLSLVCGLGFVSRYSGVLHLLQLPGQFLSQTLPWQLLVCVKPGIGALS